MKKVSVIIPVYNVEEYLEECMESVIHQTLKEIEILCVNDGSTDHSLQILEQYAKKDDRIRIISQKNGGYGKAMNQGLDAASGEYIGIVEPDDYVPLNMYEDLYRKAKEQNLDFVKADFYRFVTAENGNKELYYNHLSLNPEDYNHVFNPSETPDAIRFIMNTWSGIYKRDFLEQYKIRHHETPGASFQDNGFWFQTFIYAKRAMILDTPYYMNRRDNPNSSVNNREKVYCINQEYDYIKDILMQDEVLWKRFRHVYWFKKYHNYLGTLWRIAEEYRYEYLMRFSEELKRGIALGDVNPDTFTKKTWNNIERIVQDPEHYYKMCVYPRTINQQVFEQITKLEEENQELRQEIKKIRSSKTFRVGKLLLGAPSLLKKKLRGGR